MLLQHLIYIPAIVGLSLVAFAVGYSNFRSKLNRSFVIFTGSIIVWLLASYIADTGINIDPLTSSRFIYAAAAFLPLTLATFIVNFLRGSKQDFIDRASGKYIGILVLLAIFFACISLTSLTVEEARHGRVGVEIVKPGILLSLHVLYYLLTTIVAFFMLIARYRRTAKLEKRRIGLLIWSLAGMIVVNIIANGILVNAGSSEFGPLAGIPAVILFVLLVQFSIFKHKLFDVRLIVARSLGYLLSISALAAAYGGLAYLVTTALSLVAQGGRIVQIADILLLAVAAMSYAPIKRFFDKATNTIFYRDAYEPQKFLDELNEILVANIELEKLLEDSIYVIQQNLKTSFCVFTVRETSYFSRRFVGDPGGKFKSEDIDEINEAHAHIHDKVIVADLLEDEDKELKKMLDKHDIAVLVRLVPTLDYEIQGLGHILFGAKKSGNPFNKQDIQILEIIANELVIAVQNGLRFEEIEKFNVTLQEKIDDATHKLKKSNEKLQALDETKDEFISMASHQLRTPLTSVKGYLSMVLEGDAGETNEMQKKLLDQAFVSSQRMVYLIADLLNVSRLRTGKFVIEAIPTNLAEVIEGEAGQLKETAKARGLTLTYKKPDKFPTLMLDETKIRQVIMNFMDNAIYYTPTGGHINVELKETDKTIEYTVTDDGIGVPKSEQHHLFTKFYRAGNAKKARPDGTGLGLFMAKKVIVAQGGTLIFKSEQGKGSTFGFSFAKDKLQASQPAD